MILYNVGVKAIGLHEFNKFGSPFLYSIIVFDLFQAEGTLPKLMHDLNSLLINLTVILGWNFQTEYAIPSLPVADK